LKNGIDVMRKEILLCVLALSLCLVPSVLAWANDSYNEGFYVDFDTLNSQVPVYITYDANMSSDFSDVRFYDLAGNQVPACMDMRTNLTDATFFVKRVNDTIQVLFNGPPEDWYASRDACNQVFPFYEDFTDDYSGITWVGNLLTVEPGYIETQDYMKTYEYFPNGVEMYADVMFTGDDTASYRWVGFPDLMIFGVRYGHGNSDFSYWSDNGVDNQLGYYVNNYDNEWHRVIIDRPLSSNQTFYLDGSQATGLYNTADDTYLQAGMAGTEMDDDHEIVMTKMFVRNHTESDDDIVYGPMFYPEGNFTPPSCPVCTTNTTSSCVNSSQVVYGYGCNAETGYLCVSQNYTQSCSVPSETGGSQAGILLNPIIVILILGALVIYIWNGFLEVKTFMDMFKMSAAMLVLVCYVIVLIGML
jgi:hypothetical protein